VPLHGGSFGATHNVALSIDVVKCLQLSFLEQKKEGKVVALFFLQALEMYWGKGIYSKIQCLQRDGLAVFLRLVLDKIVLRFIYGMERVGHALIMRADSFEICLKNRCLSSKTYVICAAFVV